MALVTAGMVAAASPVAAAPGDITTFAGGGVGDNGLGTQGRLNNPEGIAVDSAGNVYVADIGNDRVRRVTPAGVITTVVGTGGHGFSGDGGQATAATLSSPSDVAVNGGNLYISELGGRIRKVVLATGIITTVAGRGLNDDSGDGGPATAAGMIPQAIALDAAGHNLYFSDQSASRVRRVDLVAGTVSAFAGIPVCYPPQCFIFPFFGGDGGPALAAMIDGPNGLAVDAAGDVFIADQNSTRVRKVDTAGIITTVAGTGDFAQSGDGGPATAAAFEGPEGLAIGPGGSLYVSDQFANTIRRIVPGPDGSINGDANDIVTTVAGVPGTFGFAGDGGQATAAQLNSPIDVAVDSAGNFYISDTANNRVRRVDHATGVVTTIAGGGIGDNDAALQAVLEAPFGVAVDRAGSVFVSENSLTFSQGPTGNRVRKIDPAGVVRTVAGNGMPGFSGDGGPATAAQLNGPRGVRLDAAGNLYIADCGNHRLRKVNTSGIITTVAGNGTDGSSGDGGRARAAALSCPAGVFVVTSGTNPAPGTLFVADAGANRVRKIDPSGVITTVAGTGIAGFSGDNGPAISAKLDSPEDVVADAAGNLFVSDENNNRVRKVNPAGTISTYAGDGAIGLGADGVPATSSHVDGPIGLTLDANGNLFIAEAAFARVRRVDRTTSKITTVAGNGNPGFSGDGGPATHAQLDRPTGVALDPAGNLLIADRNNNRVRRVQAGSPPPPPTSGCGSVITQSTVLTADVGPCPGDGIGIGADNVTLNLNHHRILGNAGRAGNHVGVTVSGRTGVTVTGGTVSGFDAGVAIVGGSGNRVNNMVASDNIGGTDTQASEFGDGIVIFFSSGNQIAGNTVTHNGPFDGIGVLGFGSNYNMLASNTVDLSVTGGVGIIISPFLSIDLPRGVSIFGNQTLQNTVRDNDGGGISNLSNINGVVENNTVTGNGAGGFPGNGIGVQNLAMADPVTHVLVANNQVHGNARNGIDVLAHGNSISGNDASNNNTGGQGFDLFDENFNCDSNVWSANVWGTGSFDPQCTTSGGHAAPGTSSPPARTTAQARPAARQPVMPDPPSRGHPPVAR